MSAAPDTALDPAEPILRPDLALAGRREVTHRAWRIYCPLLEQAVGVLLVFAGEQRWQIAPACRHHQFRPKLPSGVHSKESMAEPILLQIWPAEESADSLPNRRMGRPYIVELDIIEAADVQK
jgi:hypothetical protein